MRVRSTAKLARAGWGEVGPPAERKRGQRQGSRRSEGLRNDLWGGFSHPTAPGHGAASWGVDTRHQLHAELLHFAQPQKCGKLLPRLAAFPGHSCPTELEFTVDGHLHAPCTMHNSMQLHGTRQFLLPLLRRGCGGSLPFWPNPASLGSSRDALQKGPAWRQLFLAQTTQDGVAGCSGLTPEAGTSLGSRGQPQQEQEKSPGRLMGRCFELLKHPSPWSSQWD